MSYEKIHEPIDVIVIYDQQGVRPYWIKWQGKWQRVKVVSSWSIREGAMKIHHYSVSVGTSDCYEIVFDTANEKWELANIYLEG